MLKSISIRISKLEKCVSQQEQEASHVLKNLGRLHILNRSRTQLSVMTERDLFGSRSDLEHSTYKLSYMKTSLGQPSNLIF
jgi:hypothetical protein